jgi:glyoxylase-like metal-dependent hydrolase (beta-lactamase superfamily II)
MEKKAATGSLNRTLKIGKFELHWLQGGRFGLDGGAMFGVVPKVLWSKKYPSDRDNYVPLLAWPILVKTDSSLIIIESGLGNKLTDKQKTIFQVRSEWMVPEELDFMGIKREDIDIVILTHYDFDHAGGVVMNSEEAGLTLTFPNARHIIQRTEWEDVLNPNRRSAKSFWPVNFEILKDSRNLELVEGDVEITEGVKVIQTGGHHRGHQAVRLESEGETALYLGDLMPTNSHFNPLWITAYDNYPLDSVRIKDKLVMEGVDEDAWFIFYHDAFLLACKYDMDGNITERYAVPVEPLQESTDSPVI